ncbi:DinB family protein [Nocardia stercoris]|uniref:DinB family protein n=1 Tax=Nocardia stercoris TaxID=2483361 RepID=A0A3M2KYE2_9NOCA|nr:DinB family protein [Nocardia stercoris]RMI29470.1 DinB family protein [Nocardia stercoris]
MAIIPEDKDWTWALEKRCDECGFDAPAIEYERVPELTRAAAARLAAALDRPDVTVRPNDSTWSPLEYVAHTRDVSRLFRHRLHVALTCTAADPAPDVVGHDPTVTVLDGLPAFTNWDQDATAVAARYNESAPASVAAQLVAAADDVAADFAAVPEADRSRAARRDNGSLFTVTEMARYFLHDLVHHVHDIRA